MYALTNRELTERMIPRLIPSIGRAVHPHVVHVHVFKSREIIRVKLQV